MNVRSAYIHIPFCRHRCGYCNFSLVAGRDHLVDRFLKALKIELETVAQQHGQPISIDTLFFGGGTPSHLNEAQLGQLGDLVFANFRLNESAEVTAECNPNDLTPDRVQALTSLGVNRLSLGVQSLNSNKLKALERDHSSEEVAVAIEAGRGKVDSISIDLIFASPGERLSDWQTDLAAAIELAPDHLSTYELTYEKGTQFWNRLQRGELATAEEDLRADMYEWTRSELSDAGYQQYELSSFAKPGHQCRHNQVYWSGADYLAFGPGASRFIDGIRSTNHASTMRYMQLLESGQSATATEEQLVGLEAARERLVIGLRRIEGVNLQEFERETKHSSEEALGDARTSLLEHGLIELSHDRIRLSEAGVLLADGIASAILNQS